METFRDMRDTRLGSPARALARSGLALSALAVGGWGCSDASQAMLALETFYGELEFAVYEELAVAPPADPRLMLRVRTVENYPACTNTLDGDLDITGSVITVEVRGVAPPFLGPCPSVAKHPSLEAPLPISEGEYQIRFRILGYAETHRLTVTDSIISVTPAGAFPAHAVVRPVIRPVFRAVWRYPPRSLVVSCQPRSSPSAETHTTCEALLDELVSEGELTPITFSDAAVPAWWGPSFRYRDEEDFPRLAEMVCAFARERSGFRIQLWNWRGLSVAVASPPSGPSWGCE